MRAPIWRPSPNFNSRAAGVPLSSIVLHYTDMPNTEMALARLCGASSAVSTHYLIAQDGTLYALVPETSRAWHAGESFWRGQRDMNSASLGIELENPGHSCGYRPFTGEQLAVLEELLADLLARHQLDPRRALLAHSDIAPARKKDPGELFPWKNFAERGYGLWPERESLDLSEGDGPQSKENLALARVLLDLIGYETRLALFPEIEESSFMPILTTPEAKAKWDEAAFLDEEALRAFQRHFRPNAIDGQADGETLGLLRAVESLWNQR